MKIGSLQNEEILFKSFDITSLFINVPLHEVISICAGFLNHSPLTSIPSFPESVFVELMELVTKSVSISFNDTMYCQVDNISMGSPLGPILANIFVGFYEKLLFDRFPKPYIYLRCVNEIFTCFSAHNEALSFFHCLNDLHPSLTFTIDEEKDNKLPFLDVLVEQRSFAFVTSIYRKPTFTSLYLSWDAFAPKSTKVSLIKCLIFRTFKICSDNKIKSEFEQIKNSFLGNGYPEEVIVDTINKTAYKFRNNIRPFDYSKCPVYVRLLWIGSPSQLIADKVSFSVKRCYNGAMVRTIFITRTAFRSYHKDVLPILQQSNLIHKFQCYCNATYIGRTSQRLRVRQYVPKDIRNHTKSEHSKLLDSSICEHLNALNNCVINYRDECFMALRRAMTSNCLGDHLCFT